MRLIATICVALVLAAAPGGCAQYTHPVVAPPEMSAAERNFESVWQASQDILHEYYFEVDRRDRRARVMTTEPMTGKQWFEFWRKDSVAPYAVAESTLQTIYRVVEVRIQPAAGGDETYEPDVTVYIFRSDRRTPQVTNTSKAYSLFLLPGGYTRLVGTFLLDEGVPEEETEPGETRPASVAGGLPRWLVPVGADGRDHDLEARLAARIRSAAPQSAGGLRP